MSNNSTRSGSFHFHFSEVNRKTAEKVIDIFTKQYEKRLLMQMSRAFRKWAFEFPLNIKCDELSRQLRERNCVLETVRSSYLKDVISVKHQLEKLNKLANQPNETVVKTQVQNAIYDLHTLPTADLRNILDKASQCFNQSSGQLQNNLIEAGLLDPITGKTYNPWEQSRAYRRMKRLETGGAFNYPTTMGESIRLAAPQNHQLIVHYCTQCIGFMAFVKNWNEEIEESIRFRTEYHSVDTKIEDFKRVIKNLQDVIIEKETENIKFHTRMNELEQADLWFQKWHQVKNSSELQSYLQERERLHQEQIEKLVHEKITALEEMTKEHEVKVIQLKSTESVLKTQLHEKENELEKEIQWRYQLNTNIDILIDEKQHLSKSIQDLQKEQLNQQEEYDELERKQHSLEKLKNDLIRSINEYELDIKSLKQEHQLKSSQFQQTINSLEGEIEQLNSTNNQMIQELREKRALTNKYESQINQLTNELNEINNAKNKPKTPRLKRVVFAVICVLRLFRYLQLKQYGNLKSIGYRFTAHQQTKEVNKLNYTMQVFQAQYEGLQQEYLTAYETNLANKDQTNEWTVLQLQLQETITTLTSQLEERNEQLEDVQREYNSLRNQFQQLHTMFMENQNNLKSNNYITNLDSMYNRIKIFGYLQRHLSVHCMKSMFRVLGMINILDIPIQMKNLSLQKGILIADDPELLRIYTQQAVKDKQRQQRAQMVMEKIAKEKERIRQNQTFKNKRTKRKNKKPSFADNTTKPMEQEKVINDADAIVDDNGSVTSKKSITSTGTNKTNKSITSNKSNKTSITNNVATATGGDSIINANDQMNTMEVEMEGKLSMQKDNANQNSMLLENRSKDFASVFRNRGNRLINSFQVMKQQNPIFLNMKDTSDYWIHWIRYGRTIPPPPVAVAEAEPSIGDLNVNGGEDGTSVVVTKEVLIEAGSESKSQTSISAKGDKPSNSPEEEVPIKEESSIMSNASTTTTSKQKQETEAASLTSSSTKTPQLPPPVPVPPNDELLQSQCIRDTQSVENVSKALFDNMHSVSDYILEMKEMLYIYSRRLVRYDKLQQDYDILFSKFQAAQRQLNRSSIDASRRQQMLKIRSNTAHMLNQDASSYLATMLNAIDQVKEDYGMYYSKSSSRQESESNIPSRKNSGSVDVEGGGSGSVAGTPKHYLSTKSSPHSTINANSLFSPKIHATIPEASIDEETTTHLTTTASAAVLLQPLPAIKNTTSASSPNKRKQPANRKQSIETVVADPVKPSGMYENSEGMFESTIYSEEGEEEGEEGSLSVYSHITTTPFSSLPPPRVSLPNESSDNKQIAGQQRKPFADNSKGISQNTGLGSLLLEEEDGEGGKPFSLKRQRSKNMLLPSTSSDQIIFSPGNNNGGNALTPKAAATGMRGSKTALPFVRQGTMITIDTNALNSYYPKPTSSDRHRSTGHSPHRERDEDEEFMNELAVAQQEALLLLKRDLELKETIGSYQAQCDTYTEKIESLYQVIDQYKETSYQTNSQVDGLKKDLRTLTDAYDILTKENILLRELIQDDYCYHSEEVQKTLEEIQSHYAIREHAYYLSLQKEMKTIGTQISCSVCAIREYGFTPQDMLLTPAATAADTTHHGTMESNNNITKSRPNSATSTTTTSGFPVRMIHEEPSIIPMVHDGMAKALGEEMVLIARPYTNVYKEHKHTPSPPRERLQHHFSNQYQHQQQEEENDEEEEKNEIISTAGSLASSDIPFVEKVMIAVAKQSTVTTANNNNNNNSRRSSSTQELPPKRPQSATTIPQGSRPPSATSATATATGGQKKHHKSSSGIATTTANNNPLPMTTVVASNSSISKQQQQQGQSQQMMDLAKSLLRSGGGGGLPHHQQQAKKSPQQPQPQTRPQSVQSLPYSQSTPVLSSSLPLPSYITSSTSNIPPPMLIGTTFSSTGKIYQSNEGQYYTSASPFLSSNALQHVISSKFRKLKQIPPAAAANTTTSGAMQQTQNQSQRPYSAIATTNSNATDRNSASATSFEKNRTSSRVISNTAAYLQTNYHQDNKEHPQRAYSANALYRTGTNDGAESRPWSSSSKHSPTVRHRPKIAFNDDAEDGDGDDDYENLL